MAWDVFLSYCRSDTTPAEALAAELRARGLRVFQDEVGVHRFDSVSRTIMAELGRSRLLLAYYSHAYPTRRACQQELITAFLAGQREGDPLRRVLVVNPERGTAHIEPIELRDARFWSPSAELRHLTEAVTRKVDELPTTINAVVHGRAPLWLPAPGHRPPPRFVGRTAELWRLHSALHPQSATLTEGGGEPVAVVHGVGGIGTTSLVAEYARQFGATFPGGVFWLSAADPWTEQLTAIAEALGAKGNGHAADRVALALDAERAPSLWVVDGVPAGLDLDHVRRLLSPHPTAASVLTSTDASYAELGTGVEVPELPAAQAIRLVLNQVEAPGDRESAHKLVDAVGGHTGALLDLAGSARSAGLDSVRRRLFSRDWPVLEATAKRLLAEVDAAGDAGLDVLRAVTAFAPEPMPLPVLDGLGPVGLAVDRLSRQSVVRLVDGGALEVPAVVAHVIRHSDPDPARHERISTAALAARRERDDFAADERERAAAFRVQVELAHRVPVRPLGGGGLREAISSLHSIFAFTREQLRECGPDSSQRFGEVAERLMEEVLRPFLSEWHPALRRYEDRTQFDDTAWDPTAELRHALDALREPLLAVIRDLSRISGNPHGTRYL
ncbi:TIR domain-containing protein [Kutzneria chonburiensis]|uniref:TIR domain-containing protein n=1 Tax=Kutzneria chonburiensis TaxID=1483604 RepID=A0ABV6MWG0_9PSEU|nr:TIR domain-containing protein [Kutzneria chonburiensis]